jgi:hypothetical protein
MVHITPFTQDIVLGFRSAAFQAWNATAHSRTLATSKQF